MSSEVLGSLHCASLAVGTIPGPPALHFLCQQVVFCAWRILLLVRLWPLPDDSLDTLELPEGLLWPSLRLRVCKNSSLSAWSSPFRGPTPISRWFLSWRHCRSRSLIPSLAPSWWCPCPLMRWVLLPLSGYVLSVPSAFSLCRSRWSIPSHCRLSRAVSLLTVSVICER